MNIARKVKDGNVSQDEIKQLVDFTKEYGGIDYAEKVMSQLHAECKKYILDNVSDPDIQESLFNYVEFVIQRTKYIKERHTLFGMSLFSNLSCYN